jgi:hypothetical protein
MKLCVVAQATSEKWMEHSLLTRATADNFCMTGREGSVN